MSIFGGKKTIKSNSALAIAAGCAVAFMFIATIISVVLFRQRMNEASDLLAEAKYDQYDSYVVLISSDDKSDFWNQVYTAAKEYGEDNNVYVDMISKSVDKSYSKVELIEMAIETGCDAIFVEGDDTPETKTMLARATRAGIAVFTLSSDVEDVNKISYIGANSYSIASLTASSLVNNLVKQKKVMVIGGNTVSLTEATSYVNNIQTAIKDIELPNGNLEFDIRTVESKDAFATEEYIQNLFKNNDLAPLVICLDEESTASFYQAMIDYNKVGQILLFGSDKSATILTGIKQHVILSTVYVDAAAMGEAAAKAYTEYRDAGYVSEYISVEAKTIDATNVGKELQEVENE